MKIALSQLAADDTIFGANHDKQVMGDLTIKENGFYLSGKRRNKNKILSKIEINDELTFSRGAGANRLYGVVDENYNLSLDG